MHDSKSDIDTEMIKVNVRYKDIEFSAEGAPEHVMKSLLEWIRKYLPEIDVASKLRVDIDYIKLSEIIGKYAGYTDNGEIILKEEASKLSMSLRILIILAMANILYKLGLRASPELTIHEISYNIPTTLKTISSRLSELKSEGLIKKRKTDKGVVYWISIKGILKILNQL